MTVQQNNDIMSRLLSDAGTSIPDSKQTIDDQTTSISSSRVMSTRYKIYLLVMIIIIYGFLQYILFPTLDKQQISQGKLQNIISEVQSFANKRLQYMQDASFIKK